MFDREKLKRLIHFVIAQAGHRDGFGATKLYKVLWFAEARQYVLTGKPITGAEYVREKHGPIPKLGMQIRYELENEGKIRQMPPSSKFDGWMFKSVQAPDVTEFSKDELATVIYWINHIDSDHTATSISDESHNYGWEIAKMGETLPYHAILADRVREPTESELPRLRQKAMELGFI